MHSTVLLTFLCLLGFVLANSVTVINREPQPRIVIWTPGVHDPAQFSKGYHVAIPDTYVGVGRSVTVNFPTKWQGQGKAIRVGASRTAPGILAEVAFNGWRDATYFDVSAVNAHNDNDGIHWMIDPTNRKNNSGCKVFPCGNIYINPNDVQTKGTSSKNIHVIIGSG